MIKNILTSVSLILTFSSIGQVGYVDPDTPVDALPIGMPSCEWELVFSDEFNDNTLNTNKWSISESSSPRAPRQSLGIDGWWFKKENVSLKNGELVLLSDKPDNSTMFCGAISSRKKYEQKYGYYETRIKIADPTKGTHTAYWFMGRGMTIANQNAHDGAEIDVVESAYVTDRTALAIHVYESGSHIKSTMGFNAENMTDLDYHTFSLFWTPDFIKIYYDGQLKAEINDPQWMIHADEYMLLSTGASWGLSGNYFTKEPIGPLSSAKVDYIRAWAFKDSSAFKSFELENLGVNDQSSNQYQKKSNQIASSDIHVELQGNKVGDVIEFEKLLFPKNGEYCIQYSGLTGNNYGQYQFEIEKTNGIWTPIGDPIDLYDQVIGLDSKSSTVPVNLASGSYSIRFRCVGKNANSSGYIGSFDKITLQGGSSIISSIRKEPSIEDPYTIFPNPTVDYINVKNNSDISTEDGASYKVINQLGEQVMFKEGLPTKIDFSEYSEGIYYLHIQSKDKTVIHKVVKK